MTIGLNIDGCSHSKKTSLTTQNKIVLSRSSGCSDLKGLTWFRQSFLFSSSANEALLAGCWEATILDKRPGESDTILEIPVISGCRKSPLTSLVGWEEGLVRLENASQQQILAEICPINRLFTASGSRGTKYNSREQEMYWDNQNEENFDFKWCQLFVCVVGSTSLALQHRRQTRISDWENSRHFVTPPLVSLQNDV